jgi:hypothetical protein
LLPSDLVVSKVTDSAAHLVHKFSPDGRLLMTLGKTGVAGDNTRS